MGILSKIQVLIEYQLTTKITILFLSFVPESDSAWWDVYTTVDTIDIHVRILGDNLTSMDLSSVNIIRNFKIVEFSRLEPSNYKL